MDGEGYVGALFHYGLSFALFGSALLCFFYFWSKGRLDMDEEPKFKMLEDQDE